ncbi:hypothetical protein ACQPW1_20550 [Nocardia sp. CA-128927]|uniref:hypothetical protein n=1 Tax=Nocardia sp. CA-128927 TaxID=3239975 RepID=UPI003D956F0E
MNPLRPKVAGESVKLICSCVRNASALLDGREKLVPVNNEPRDGDLVLVRCLDGKGAYDHVEDETGAAVRIYPGDVFVALLGTRRSGTNLVGEVPDRPLATGDPLDLVAQGGLVATCVAVPAYYGSRAMPVEVVGFPGNGRIVNIADAPVIPIADIAPEPTDTPVLFVCGTSAEVGKTTLVCNLGIAAKRCRPNMRIAAIKACGTGRARDRLHYRDANYDVVTDFVDAGMPSTYDVDVERFRAMLRTLIRHCADRADLVVVEIGGDLLEARAPEALEIMVELQASCVLVTNDAMGACDGLRRLDALGSPPLRIGSLKQNSRSLADRLGVPLETILEMGDPAASERLVELVI